jgi:WD40 repeat protein/tRNA A-37 threonylcarbamoyl transferase component Bud32
MHEADLFERALGIGDSAGRAEFLARACGDDTELLARVERLLAVYDRGEAWPDRTLPEALGLDAGIDSDDGPGLPEDFVVEGITLLRLIGSGGFGRVYEAWQQGARRHVAVKVLRRDRCDAEIVARFVRESRLAATLSHPGIATVHAVGTAQTAHGPLPYLVTELVAGARRLTEHAAGLDRNESVRLLTSVCRAVGHAHSRNIVHRDLKPANVLVGTEGLPKVIDFGWARALDGDQTQATAITQPGQIAGTWQYMSPEHFDPEGLPVDARADVWALGVIAYQILGGRLPYDVRGRPVRAIIDLVRSVRVPTLTAIDDTIPLPLSRIVEKCLATDPARRYAEAGAIADDFDRFSAGEAVLARGPTFGESLALLVRRHPVGTAALAGLFLGLVVAVVGILRARQAEQEAHATALHRLYSGHLLGVGEAAEDGDTPEARSLVAEAIDVAVQLGIADRRTGTQPLELRLAEATAEGALAVIAAHAGLVDDLAYSPDGRVLASCGPAPGWRLWDATHGTLLAEAEAGGPAVRFIRFSPDGRVLATVDENGGLQLRDPVTGAIEVALSQSVRVRSGIVFSPDGTRLLTAGADHICRIWNVADGTLERSLAAHPGFVNCLAWSPDGSTIATASGTAYRLWNAADGALVETRRPHRKMVKAIAFSPDSTVVATGALDGGLRLWRHREAAEDIVLEGHQGAVRCLAFSPDGTVLATGSKDRTLRLWNVDDGSPRGRPAVHEDEVVAVAFTPDSTRAISGAANGTVGRWDAIDGGALGYLLGHCTSITAMALPSGGDRLATAGLDGEIRLWRGDDPGLHDVVATAGEPVDFLRFARDARRLAVGTREGKMTIFDAWANVELASVRPDSGRWETFAASDDLRCMAAGSQRGSIFLWNVNRGSSRLLGIAHDAEVSALAFCPDGTRMVSGGKDGAVRLWDPETGDKVATLRGHAGAVTCVVTSPDGTCGASASVDGTVHVWRVADGDLIASCDAAGGAVHGLAFGRDGAALAVARGDNSVTIHDPRRGTLLRRLPTSLGRIRSVVFSPDGKRLATTHEIPTTLLWDTSDWSLAATLPGRNVQTGPTVFSPDSARVVLGGADGVIRLWDHERVSVLFTMKAHPLTILTTAVSPDGRLVASGSTDGMVRIHGRRQREVFADQGDQQDGVTAATNAGDVGIRKAGSPGF